MVNEGNDTGIDRVTPTGAMRGRSPRMLSGMVWMALGIVAGFMVPFFGVVMMGYGMREMVEASGTKGFLIAALEAAIIAAGASFSNQTYAAMVAISFVAVAGTVWLMRAQRATVGGVSVLVAVVTLLNIGVEMSFAMMAGTTVSEVYQGMFTAMTDGALQAAGGGIQAELMVQQLEPVFMAIWPFVYVVSSLSDVLAASIGSFLMGARTSGMAKMPLLASFDMPLWPVAALALSVLGLGVSAAGFPGSQLVLTVSATALLSVRIIFALQGFGVVLSLMGRYRLGCFGRTALTVLSIWLETMFFLVSIVGLVDVWANFRKLERSSSRNRAHS